MCWRWTSFCSMFWQSWKIWFRNMSLNKNLLLHRPRQECTTCGPRLEIWWRTTWNLVVLDGKHITYISEKPTSKTKLVYTCEIRKICYKGCFECFDLQKKKRSSLPLWINTATSYCFEAIKLRVNSTWLTNFHMSVKYPRSLKLARLQNRLDLSGSKHYCTVFV